jgi:polysaccharide biosynthesis/export protein
MRTAPLAALLAVLTVCAVQAQESTPPTPEKPAPEKTAEAKADGQPQKPPTDPKPVSLSPVMPVDVPNPAVMAEGPGAKRTGAPVGDAYIIGPEDVLGVKIWEDPHMTGSYNVLSDGTISIPLLGLIRAAGLTPPELEESINHALLKYFRVSHTAVQVDKVGSKKIYFDGEGIANGDFAYMLPLHLFEAISAKGGFKDFANKNHIKVWRDGKVIIDVSYSDLLKGKHPEKNIMLKDKDHVIVN